jgi:polysaccharide export outer membrane protein
MLSARAARGLAGSRRPEGGRRQLLAGGKLVSESTWRDFPHDFAKVETPRQFPYISALTIHEAVAIAGVYTYRAGESDAILIRRMGPQRQPVKVPVHTIVLPGDFIEIEERFF